MKSLDYDDGTIVHGRSGNTVMYKCWPSEPWLVFNNKYNQFNNWVLSKVKLRILLVDSTLNKAVLIKAIAVVMPIAHKLNIK